MPQNLTQRVVDALSDGELWTAQELADAIGYSHPAVSEALRRMAVAFQPGSRPRRYFDPQARQKRAAQ